MRNVLPASTSFRDSLFFRFTNSSLQEKRLTEFQLQHLWFEHLLPEQLIASDGRTFKIIQTGWWNHESGPDFLDATIQEESGKIYHGDIEIHLNAADWKQHGHHSDANYNRLILHVAWQGQASIALANGKKVPNVILESQLPEPLTQLLTQIPEIRSPSLPLAQPGSCETHFQHMEMPSIRHFLQEAGWHRLYLKSEKLRRQIQRDGPAQTLWEAFAETLGYKENKIPFRYLARLYPIAQMKKVSLEERDSLFLGASGFLPKIETATWQKENRHYASKLWHRWWSKESRAVPSQLWQLAHTRPTNHPQRRMAALSLIAEKFSEITTLLKKQEVKKLTHFLQSLSHLFFSFHYTLKSKPSDEPMALLGEKRVNEMLINLVFPWLLAHHYEKKETILQLAPSQENVLTKLMTQRLFSFPFKPKSALEQQGLLQIFHSFCSATPCQKCSLPKFIETWNNQNSLYETYS